MESEIKTRVTPFSEPYIPAGGGQDCLVVIYAPSSNQLGKRFSLSEGAVRIGRGPENDVVLHSDSVSRRHARVETRSGGYVVVDMHSTNGTYVNDELVDAQALRRGDQLKVGDTIMKFLSGADRSLDTEDDPKGSGAWAARNRLVLALAELGDGLADVALRCCCMLEGLETAEKRLGWSARSGKIVLRIALIRLREHYRQQGGLAGGLIG